MKRHRAGWSTAAQLSPTPDRDAPDGGAWFPVVGIGGSAGGLAAFTQFLEAMPADSGMAFVLVPHLAPAQPSALVEILSRATRMQVTEVVDKQAVEPNRVYVIPPDRRMTLNGGLLLLQPREGGAMHRPVDHFLTSLAQDRRHQAIGVVLSGTATDGTLGLEAIRGEGGITFAQDATAQHEGMPHSAIASGCVDLVLPADEIAREIVRISRHPLVASHVAAPEGGTTPDLTPVITLLRHATGTEFSAYKRNTLCRRITRRMAFRRLDSLTDYVAYLRETPAELDALYQDILISVTSFFRDPEAFEALASQVFPRLLEGRSKEDPVRLWTVGCSTGQEAYSLAIAFTEAAEAAGSQAKLQLFATDVNPTCIEKARAGIYPKHSVHGVSPERLRRFFTEIDGGYRIDKQIRQACVFSQHDVQADPPFSRIDLISCRNLMIYFEPELQRRIVSLLHYALVPLGYLWLGSSEVVGDHSNLFDVLDQQHKIHVKTPGSHQARGRTAGQHHGLPRSPLLPISALPSKEVDLLGEADRILSTRFGPPGIVVSANLEILQFRGDTGPYIVPSAGKASLSLVKMLREGLFVGVREAIIRADQEASSVRQGGMRVEADGISREVVVEVVPVGSRGDKQGGFLVLFEDAAPRSKAAASGGPRGSTTEAGSSREAPPADGPEHARLVQELASTRRYLRSLVEQQEVATEELQSANEEVQSANEELQSTIEELETSKEELQVSNEELNIRNTELNRLNNELVNLLSSIHTPVVMLGPDLRIQRFTPAAAALLNLTQAHVGRLLADVTHSLGVFDMTSLLQEVLDGASVGERDVQDSHGRWFSLRARPFRDQGGDIDGVVVMLIDVDALKRAHAYTESIVATVREPLIVLDKDLRVRTASRSFYEDFHATPESTETRAFFELGNGQWDIPELRRQLEDMQLRDSQIVDLAVELEFEHIGVKTMLLNSRRLIQTIDQDPLILLAIEDITERSRQASQLQKQAVALADRERRKDEFLATLSHELRAPLTPIVNAVKLLDLQRSGEDPIQQKARGILRRQVDQMCHLVDDLLDVSRINSGRIQLRRARIAVSSVVEGALDTVRPMIEERQHELTVLLPPEPIWLYADATRLEQVLANLLTNAAKFTEDGGHVWLRAQEEGDHCVLRVKDSGIGIAPDLLPHVFELFAQAERSLDRSAGGLGIGLALVRKLTALHGGRVEVHSAPGQGSEFVVYLPLATAEAALLPQAPAATPPQEALQPVARSLRVLVVDDNVDTASSSSMLLKLQGHQVWIAHDGPTALRAADDRRPDVVLLDIGLPGMDGYEVASELRKRSRLQHVTLVALTGYGSPKDRARSQAAGFDHHMVKPIDFDKLDQILASVGTRR